MKIRTQFIISTAVFGMILLLVSVLVIITNRRVEKAHQQEELATQIEREAYELGYLADDYLLHRESQQAARWESKFASFSNDLLKMDVSTLEQQALLANIRTNQHRLEAVFAEIRASIESAPQPNFDEKFMQLSWSRLEVQNQGMIFDASRLAGRLREQEDQLRQMTSLLSLVLIGVLGTFLLGIYGLTFRRTLRAIAELQAGTRIIGSGDLDFAIALKNEDEIGELSHAFNQMTANLKQVTASKADLEKEIMERRRAEDALRESESKYRNLFENMVEEVHFWQIIRDETGQIKTWRLVDANSPTLKTWGRRSAEEIRGKTSDEIFGPGATDHYMPVVQKIITDGLPYTYEDYFPNLDRYFRFTSVPLGDYFITTGADITSIKKASEVLQQKEAELREAQRIAHIGSWHWDARTDATTGSDELLRIYGFDPATQTMPNFREQRGRCYPVGDWERVNLAVQRTLETGEGYELDVEAIRGRDLIWVTTRGEVVHDAEGQVVGLRGTVQDISERKQAEAALFRNEVLLQAVMDHIPEAIYLKDRDGKLLLANPATLSVIGKPPEAVLGKTDAEFYDDPATGRAIMENDRRVMNSGQMEVVEESVLDSAGTRVYLSTKAPYRDAEGQIIGLIGVARDITERKQTEAELARLASFPGRNPNPIVELEYSGDIVYMNPKARELFPDIASPGFGHPLLAGLEQFIQKFKAGEPETHLTQEVKVGEAYYHQSIMNIPERERIRLYHTDITKRKRAEEALRRNEAFLLETGKMAKVGGWELDPQTMQPTWTLETYHIHEVDPSLQPELEGAIDFYAPEARPHITEAVHRAIEEGQPYDLELPLITAKGRHIWIRTIGQPEFRDGRCLRLFGTIQDITERKQAEEALLVASLQKQASEYARTLIEVSLDPLVTISPEGKITDVNEATVKATGVPRAELIGTNFSSYFTEPEMAEQGYRQVFAQGYATDYPLTLRHCDGRLMDVLYNVSIYKDANGNVLGAFAAARDVTAQKQAEAELKRHKEDLEILVKERTSELEESSRELSRSNENLQQFAYVASHDLQEPLRVMSSYSQLLERRYKGRLDQDADDFIAFIVDAAARMQKLITDLLAYSRAGHETSNMVEVDCNRVIRRLVTGMAPTIESAEGRVTFDSLPCIMAHESSLVQLFQNLIGNALKFRGEQPPRIHVSARQAEGEWVFSVRDNGLGIELQYCERIFMIFQRLHPRDKYPGTGIGLSICRKIVENLGGRIWVESEPGQGSTFYFTLPIQKD